MQGASDDDMEGETSRKRKAQEQEHTAEPGDDGSGRVAAGELQPM
jgi:hypothetical protein